MVQPVRSRGQTYRYDFSAKGMRSVQIRATDSRAPGFKAMARRQCLAVNAADRRDGVMEFLESIEGDLFDEDAR
jgi:hypothetical protein